MKKKHSVFFGIAVMLIAAMFTMTGCNLDGDDDDDGDAEEVKLYKKHYAGTTWKDQNGTVTYTFTADGYTTTSDSETTTYDGYSRFAVTYDGWFRLDFKSTSAGYYTALQFKKDGSSVNSSVLEPTYSSFDRYTLVKQP